MCGTNPATALAERGQTFPQSRALEKHCWHRTMKLLTKNIHFFFFKFEYLLIFSQCTIINNFPFYFSKFPTPQGREILNEEAKNSTYLQHL
jgi:hypothetical protein